MFIKILLNYILGYLNIKIEGVFVERFINICNSNKITLWNIKKEKGIVVYANIGIQDFKKLRPIIKKTQTNVKILNKKGLPFFLNSYKKRKIFAIFLLSIIILLFVMSKFIWNIEIKGNKEISTQQILLQLKEEGIKTGVLKSKIHTRNIINKIRLKNERIAWIGITIKGTNVEVKIKETDLAPEILDENDYCNIKSNKNGIITKISVQNGTPLVKEGDIIKEGDLLVAGYLEGKYTGIRYVHSLATIEAKIWYTKKEKVGYTQEVKEYTENVESKYKLKINNFKINFYKTLSNFEKYDTINESKKIMLFSNFYLPIEIVKQTNKEYILKEKTYTKEELVDLQTEKLKQEIEQEINEKENILNKHINVYEGEGYLEVEVIYEVLETIGVEDKIIY